MIIADQFLRYLLREASLLKEVMFEIGLSVGLTMNTAVSTCFNTSVSLKDLY